MGDRRRALHVRNLDELSGNQRPPESGSQWIPLFVERICLERGQDVVARELFADVEYVAPGRAGRDRALANLVELAPRPQIERDGTDVAVFSFSQGMATDVSSPPE
jgi:hypothetical protein